MQSMESSTNNNIEHQAIEFVTDTMMPRVARFEAELNTKLFKPGDKMYVKFNLNAIMRGDMAARGEWYTKMVNFGIMNPNEVRELEELNAREGGDTYMSPANLMTDKQRENALSK
jgi:HK97 family phage portal protein